MAPPCVYVKHKADYAALLNAEKKKNPLSPTLSSKGEK
jgi:hypothetical protein